MNADDLGILTEISEYSKDDFYSIQSIKYITHRKKYASHIQVKTIFRTGEVIAMFHHNLSTANHNPALQIYKATTSTDESGDGLSSAFPVYPNTLFLHSVSSLKHSFFLSSPVVKP